MRFNHKKKIKTRLRKISRIRQWLPFISCSQDWCSSILNFISGNKPSVNNLHFHNRRKAFRFQNSSGYNYYYYFFTLKMRAELTFKRHKGIRCWRVINFILLFTFTAVDWKLCGRAHVKREARCVRRGARVFFFFCTHDFLS